MKNTYDKEVDYISGETIVGGTYRCRGCDYQLKIEPGKVTNLPICPRCQSQHWDSGR
jgi:predicted Zn-ribbon and HTH transcriptional regulator